jgi:hypothetical protein
MMKMYEWDILTKNMTNGEKHFSMQRTPEEEL